MENNKILKDKILLPINPKGKPDFQFMEQYVKNIFAQKYAAYLQYVETKTI